jgi:plastocyanin
MGCDRNAAKTWLAALLLLACCTGPACAQESEAAPVEVTGHIDLSKRQSTPHEPNIVVWLNPVNHAEGVPAPRPGRYTLEQKKKMFSPHLLVIPVGSTVSFPNDDPFFHNVFSLFNGKRFDLGLYEAGSTRDVVFSREGVSYIFCNIHPEMSAVVLSLATALHTVADASGRFTIHSAPPGEYELHVWIEGTPQPALDRLTRRVRVRAGIAAMAVDASNVPHAGDGHLNKFGKPYDRDAGQIY